MRKIEKQMLEAIREGRNWQGGNTTVAHYPKDSGIRFCTVTLHGNHIADVWDGGKCGEVSAVADTFKRWPTRTTVSRLRALGIDASTRKGVACINGEPV